VRVRPAVSSADWRGVRDLCCETGEAGGPIAPARWPFFAERWIGPYQRVRPDWTYVVEEAGRVVGYLTGCPDTRAFRRACRTAWTWRLLLRVARGEFGWSGDARRFVRQVLGLDRGVEARLARRLPVSLDATYPAHLHMNVAADRRGQGLGRALFDCYAEDLRRRGVTGVHLFCGKEPLTFYRRQGFEELGRLDLRDGSAVFLLARRLGRAPGPAEGR
jgi:GNAT superfamily N-acetyltransferase